MLLLVLIVCLFMSSLAAFVYTRTRGKDEPEDEPEVKAVPIVTPEVEPEVDEEESTEEPAVEEPSAPASSIPKVTSINGLSDSDVAWIEANKDDFNLCAYVEPEHEGMYTIVNTSSLGVMDFKNSENKLGEIKTYMAKSKDEQGEPRSSYKSLSYQKCVLKDIHGVKIKPSDLVRIYTKDNKILTREEVSGHMDDIVANTTMTANSAWKISINPDNGNVLITSSDDVGTLLWQTDQQKVISDNNNQQSFHKVLSLNGKHAILYAEKQYLEYKPAGTLSLTEFESLDEVEYDFMIEIIPDEEQADLGL